MGTKIAIPGIGFSTLETAIPLVYGYLCRALSIGKRSAFVSIIDPILLINRLVCRKALVRNRAATYGDQFGVSFSNKTIMNQNDFNTAVAELRNWPASGQTFFDWLLSDAEVNWQSFLDKLQNNYDTSTLIRKLFFQFLPLSPVLLLNSS